MSSDPLSDVLQLAEATSVVSGTLAAGGTWAFRFRFHDGMKFYVVAEGGCWLRPEGRPPVRLAQGDVVLLSGPAPFVIASSRTARARDACPVSEQGGDGAQVGTRVECVLVMGAVSLHPSSVALFTSALPTLVHVRSTAPDVGGLRWMIERIAHERRAGLPGASVVAAQFAQILFVQAVRAELAGAAALPPGWLRAIRDPRIARALRVMHDEPARAWTLIDLSKAAAMSRARFAARFKSEAGVAPLEYLTGWRMRIAQKKLRDEDAPVAELAASLGYSSESAFSHAFKRVIGTAPRDYRNAVARRSSMSSIPPRT